MHNIVTTYEELKLLISNNKICIIDGARSSGKTTLCKILSSDLHYDYFTTFKNRKNREEHLHWVPIEYGGIFILDYLRQLDKSRMNGVIIDRSNITCVVFNNQIPYYNMMKSMRLLMSDAGSIFILNLVSKDELIRRFNNMSSTLDIKLLNRVDELILDLLNEQDKYISIAKKYCIPFILYDPYGIYSEYHYDYMDRT